MTLTQIAFTIATAVLIPMIVAEFRWRSRLLTRVQNAEAFIDFLKAYLLKNAVLEFHSPDPKHKDSDRVIERLVEGEELSAEEIGTLARRIESVAKYSEDAKRRLRATETL